MANIKSKIALGTAGLLLALGGAVALAAPASAYVYDWTSDTTKGSGSPKSISTVGGDCTAKGEWNSLNQAVSWRQTFSSAGDVTCYQVSARVRNFAYEKTTWSGWLYGPYSVSKSGSSTTIGTGHGIDANYHGD